jgi:hypothetical protein
MYNLADRSEAQLKTVGSIVNKEVRNLFLCGVVIAVGSDAVSRQRAVRHPNPSAFPDIGHRSGSLRTLLRR